MKNQWKMILSIVLLIIVVIFALKNTQVVKVDFIFANFEVQLVLVMLLCVLLGVIIGLLGSFTALSNLKKEKNQLNKDYVQVKEELLREKSERDKEIAKLRSHVSDLKNKKQNTLVVDETFDSLVES